MRQMRWDVAQHANVIRRVVAGQRGGGCEIRTREGLPPTRFPSLRFGVRVRPGPSVTCGWMLMMGTGGRLQTQANETTNETVAEVGGITPASPAREILLDLNARRACHESNRVSRRRRRR